MHRKRYIEGTDGGTTWYLLRHGNWQKQIFPKWEMQRNRSIKIKQILLGRGPVEYAFQTRNPCPEVYGHNNLLTAQIELEHRDVCLHAAIIL